MIEICPRCDGSGFERSARIERCKDCGGRGYTAALIIATEPVPVKLTAAVDDQDARMTRYVAEVWTCRPLVGDAALAVFAARCGVTADQVLDIVNFMGVRRCTIEMLVAPARFRQAFAPTDPARSIIEALARHLAEAATFTEPELLDVEPAAVRRLP